MVATEDQENPAIGLSAKLAFLMGIPAAGYHQGQRADAPHLKAGDMTAASQIVRNAKKVLAIGGRPHMSGWSAKSDKKPREDHSQIF